MVQPSKCLFCGKTYGDAEQHSCEEHEEWKSTLIGQAAEARRALKVFAETLMEEAEKAMKILEDKAPK